MFIWIMIDLEPSLDWASCFFDVLDDVMLTGRWYSSARIHNQDRGQCSPDHMGYCLGAHRIHRIVP